MSNSLTIAGRTFRSRLIVGTGKYKSFQETARALEASGAEMVTVAVRRVNLDRGKESLLDFIDPKKYFLLPNTAGVFAKRLIEAGAATVMPLGAPIGSGMGIQNQAHIRILREMITAVPLIVDAGVGTASDAALAMELGADAVLMNTGIAAAQDPVLMAEAMHHAVIAGRQAYLAGRMPKKLYATASSPLEGVVK
jgi:thiazole synthase ThiGH ThiG subunit